MAATARRAARDARPRRLKVRAGIPLGPMTPRRVRAVIIDLPPPSARTEGCAILHALSPRTARGAHSGRQSGLRGMPRAGHAGIMIEAQKGTRDILPEEIGRWQLVEDLARETFERYGFGEIRTPIFESTELFARGIGEGSDIVSREMYTFVDRGGRSLTLRPENTAPVARAVLQHQLHRGSGLQRLYYIGPMFRYERPQKGRMRQFRQI